LRRNTLMPPVSRNRLRARGSSVFLRKSATAGKTRRHPQNKCGGLYTHRNSSDLYATNPSFNSGIIGCTRLGSSEVTA
jgi:hypothetical protein